MVKKSLLSKSVEWFVCWISTKESNLGYTFLSLFSSWFFSSFSHNSFHTFHTVFCFECSPDAAFIFSRLREGWEPLIAFFFVSFRIPGGTEEGLSSVYCLQCTGWKASIWKGISPALLLNRAIQVSLFPIRLQFAIIFKRTQDGVHLKALKGFHHSFFFSTSFFLLCEPWINFIRRCLRMLTYLRKYSQQKQFLYNSWLRCWCSFKICLLKHIARPYNTWLKRSDFSAWPLEGLLRVSEMLTFIFCPFTLILWSGIIFYWV